MPSLRVRFPVFPRRDYRFRSIVDLHIGAGMSIFAVSRQTRAWDNVSAESVCCTRPIGDKCRYGKLRRRFPTWRSPVNHEGAQTPTTQATPREREGNDVPSLCTTMLHVGASAKCCARARGREEETRTSSHPRENTGMHVGE